MTSLYNLGLKGSIPLAIIRKVNITSRSRKLL